MLYCSWAAEKPAVARRDKTMVERILICLIRAGRKRMGYGWIDMGLDETGQYYKRIYIIIVVLKAGNGCNQVQYESRQVEEAKVSGFISKRLRM
jgi:hypothetical protein